MTPRASGSAVVSFGLVSIPIRLFPTMRRRPVSHFPTTIEGNHERLDVLACVPLDELDVAVLVRSAHYLTAGPGGDRGLALFALAMARAKKACVGRLTRRGRTRVVVLRPYRGGLVLQELFDVDEVRNVEELDRPGPITFKAVEENLASRLVEQLSIDGFDVAAFAPRHPEQRDANVIDLFDWLRRSLDPYDWSWTAVAANQNSFGALRGLRLGAAEGATIPVV